MFRNSICLWFYLIVIFACEGELWFYGSAWQILNKMILSENFGQNNKHHKNCECCSVSLLIEVSLWMLWLLLSGQKFHEFSQVPWVTGHGSFWSSFSKVTSLWEGRSPIEPLFEVSAEQLEMCEVGHHSPTQLENTFSIWIDFYTEPDFKLNHISLEYLTIFCLVFENVYICIHMNTFVWNSEYFDIWSRHFVWIFWYLCEYFDTHISFALPLNFWPSNIFRADLAISRTKKKNSFPQKSMHIESF